MKQRCSGILLAVSSLPGPYGIGSLGAPARRFVDFLVESGQTYWQILPLVPPGIGNSPYMSTSAFAGSPYNIDLDELVADGLLAAQDLTALRSDCLDCVDYDLLSKTRMTCLRTAWNNARKMPQNLQMPTLPWLRNYAEFAALSERYQTPYQQWPENAVADEEEIAFHEFVQGIFYRQWISLKEYANKRGIHIMGDIPIYLSPNSAECRSQPHLFQRDKSDAFSAVAGVPPDAFSSEGQFWGNPLYDWVGHKQEVFDFWCDRIRWCSRIFDAVRIDHFRAFHSYWSIAADAASAKEGQWQTGPGMELLTLLRQTAPELELIAEDLGNLEQDCQDFVKNCGIPGMKVLTFAFDASGESAYLPHNCPRNSVIYTGTHDSPTFIQWLNEASQADAQFATEYLRLRMDEGLGWGAVAGAMSSPSYLAITPMQDILGLGADARMNTPGTVGDHNWSWRVRAEALNPYVASKLLNMTRTYRRTQL